jgi:hypothetical protein
MRLCRLGFHDFAPFTVRETQAKGIFVAHTKCRRCPSEHYGDPDQIHSVFFAPGELNKMIEIPTPPTADKGIETPSNVNRELYDYEVKSWPAFFSKMITGVKKHDMRDKRERDYKVGDRVLLREYDPFGGGYTGRAAVFLITYITSNDTPCAMSSNALDRDACILSVALMMKQYDS